MQYFQGMCKDWLKTLPSYENKVRALRDLHECQVSIAMSMTQEQQDKLAKAMETIRD
jgi:hypothetical protein